MNTKKVKSLYSLLNGKWYDPFTRFYYLFYGAEYRKELDSFLINNISSNKRILELGCGSGLVLEKINSLNLEFKHYLGIDFSDEMLTIFNDKFKSFKNVTSKNLDLCNISKSNSLFNSKYDIVLCINVLEHLNYPSVFVNQTQNMLSKNGKMLLFFLSEQNSYTKMIAKPIFKFIFKSQMLSNVEMNRFKNVKKKIIFSSNFKTLIEIHNTTS